MSYIAGIDYSTKYVDIVLISEDPDEPLADWHRFGLWMFAGDAFDRSRHVHESLPSRGWWEDLGVVAVGIEDPRGYAAGHLYRVQGGILQCLPHGLLVQPWVPSAWRRAVGLPGNATKLDVAEHVYTTINDRLAPLEWPQDALDAYCIALATRGALVVGDEAAA